MVNLRVKGRSREQRSSPVTMKGPSENYPKKEASGHVDIKTSTHREQEKWRTEDPRPQGEEMAMLANASHIAQRPQKAFERLKSIACKRGVCWSPQPSRTGRGKRLVPGLDHSCLPGRLPLIPALQSNRSSSQKFSRAECIFHAKAQQVKGLNRLKGLLQSQSVRCFLKNAFQAATYERNVKGPRNPLMKKTRLVPSGVSSPSPPESNRKEGRSAQKKPQGSVPAGQYSRVFPSTGVEPGDLFESKFLHSYNLYNHFTSQMAHLWSGNHDRTCFLHWSALEAQDVTQNSTPAITVSVQFF